MGDEDDDDDDDDDAVLEWEPPDGLDHGPVPPGGRHGGEARAEGHHSQVGGIISANM